VVVLAMLSGVEGDVVEGEVLAVLSAAGGVLGVVVLAGGVVAVVSGMLLVLGSGSRSQPASPARASDTAAVISAERIFMKLAPLSVALNGTALLASRVPACSPRLSHTACQAAARALRLGAWTTALAVTGRRRTPTNATHHLGHAMPARYAASDAPAPPVPPADAKPTARLRLAPLIASAFDAASSVRHALWALVLVATGFIVYATASLLLPIVVACTLALLLAPAVTALNRLRLPQPASAGIVMLAVLLALGALAINIAGPVQRWIETAPQQMRKLEHRLELLLRPVEAVREATETVSEIATKEKPQKPREVVLERGGLGSIVNLTVDTIVTVLSTIMLAYFLLACGDVLMRKLITVTPEREDKIRMVEILRTIQREIGRYFATITLVNIGLGVATGLALWALGMPTPAVWGVAVALLNFLPYLGPLIVTVMLTAVGLLTYDSPLGSLAPPAAFLLLNFIEDQLILPFLLGRSLSLNPVVIFLWVLIWAWMWGIGGLLLAVPLLVALRICAERLPKLKPVAVVLAGGR
jgi:predicted PurR-regulated permease PerM